MAKKSVDEVDAHGVAFGEACWLWMKIGWINFGGPAAHIALMHRLLVCEKKWIGESRFLHALNYCMLLPGPEAQQLAIYLGWLLHRIRGGIVAGVLFVLPGALIMLGISILYVQARELAAVQAVLFGVKAAVLAIVFGALVRLGAKMLKNFATLTIAALAFIALFFFAAPFPPVIAVAAALGALGYRFAPRVFAQGFGNDDVGDDGDSNSYSDGNVNARDNADSDNNVNRVNTVNNATPIIDRALRRQQLPHTVASPARAIRIGIICLTLWLAPIALLGAWLGAANVYVREGWFFAKMAVVTFGGAYSVLAYMAQQAVETHAWLSAGEMLDGLGLAESTPGPLIMVVQFVGFLGAHQTPGALPPLIAGAFGALLATWVTFAPCFLWIFLGAPYIESLRRHRAIRAALAAIGAAVVGVVLNLSLWFAMHVLFGELREVRVGALQFAAPEWHSIDVRAVALLAVGAVVLRKFGIVAALLASAVVAVGVMAI